MKYLKLIIASLILLGCLILGQSQLVHANSTSASFAAKIIPASHQTDPNLSYFDLIITPKQTKTLQVQIGNLKNKATTVKISINPATTNINGVVNYGADDKPLDQSLNHNLKDYLSTKEKQVVLPPNSQKIVTLTLKAPENDFTGTIAGGINIQEVVATQKSNSTIGIQNTYAYAIAVLLHQKDQLILPKFKLGTIKTGQLLAKNQIIADIRNVMPKYQNQTTVDAIVTKKNHKKVIYRHQKKHLQFAPNSYMRYNIPLNDRFKAGEYTLKLKVTSDNKTWYFTKDFKITRQAAQKWNQKDVSLPKESHLWLYTSLIILVLLIFLGFAFYRQQKENRKLKQQLKK